MGIGDLIVNIMSLVAIVAGGIFLGYGTSWEIGTGAALLTWANWIPIK